MANEDLLETWRERFEDFVQSEMTVRDWCDFNRIPQHQYYYWRRKLVNTSPQIAASSSASEGIGASWMSVAIGEERSQTSLTLRVALGTPGAEIDVHSDFSPDLLRAVVHALGTAPC